MKAQVGIRLFVSPGTRSSSLPLQTLVTVGFNGVAEFFLIEEIKEQCQQMTTMAQTMSHTPTHPSIISNWHGNFSRP
jgi:hypothetical protein